MGTTSIRGLRGEAREAHARGALRRLASSGLSGAAFCRGEGISPMTLRRWRRAFGEAAAPSPGGRFVEVRLDRGACGAAYEIHLASGRQLRIPPGFDADDVARLLRIADARSC